MENEKVVIIGSGPAGLSAAIYTARASLSPLVFAGSPPGGQLMLTSEVENYPGFDSILGQELIMKMRKQAEKFGARIIDENVIKVDFSKRPFKIDLSQKTFFTQSVIIATGAKALWLGVSGEERFRGKGVSVCATCDGFFFRDKIVAVVGGGDTALEEALTLTKFAKKVYIIHRRNEFRASKIMQQRVFANPKIEVIWNMVVKEVLGNERVEGVRLESVSMTTQHRDFLPTSPPSSGGSPKSLAQNQMSSSSKNFDSASFELKIDGLFVAIGHRPDTEIFKGQLEMDEKGYIITSQRLAVEWAKSKIQNSKFKVTIENSKLEKIKDKFNFDYNYLTSVEGVFAAGDCVDFVYRQASVAVGAGVAAALEVEKYLVEIIKY